MAFLAPLAADGMVAGASSALGAGLTAGTALTGGAKAVGLSSIFAKAAPALGGLPAGTVIPGLASAAPGLGGIAPGIFAKASPALGGLQSLATPGIFAKASPALGGLSSFAPTAAQTAPGLLKTAGMSPLGGMQSVLPSAARVAPNVVGQNQVLAEFSRQGLGQGLPELGKYAGEVTKLPGSVDPTKGLLGNVPKAPPTVSSVSKAATSPFTEATNKSVLDAIQVSKEVPRVLPAQAQRLSPIVSGESFMSNLGNLAKNPSVDAAMDYVKEHPYASAGAAYGLYNMMQPKPKQPEVDKGMIRPYEFDYNPNAEAYGGDSLSDTSERMYFNPMFTAQEPYKAAEGGLMGLAVGGPVETMSAMNAVGGNMQYPQAGMQTALYSNPMMQRPEAVNVISPGEGPAVGAYTGEQKFAAGGDTKEPKTEGQYSYSYDPKTLTFTQLTTPRYVESIEPQGYPGFGGGQAAINAAVNSNVNRPPLNTGAKVSGGIATPVGGSGVAALATQARATPTNIPAYQSPEERLGLSDFYAMMNRRLGEMGGYAAGGGVSDLGGYSDGGRLLKGPGDGVSDSIPAVIGQRQPARLADGEFVVPARIVSEIGNGSTEAGARKLYAMMDRVQKARRKTVGKDKVAANTKADKYLPA